MFKLDGAHRPSASRAAAFAPAAPIKPASHAKQPQAIARIAAAPAPRPKADIKAKTGGEQE